MQHQHWAAWDNDGSDDDGEEDADNDAIRSGYRSAVFGRQVWGQ